MVEDWQGYQEDEARHQGRYLLAEADRELTPDDQLSAVQRGPDGGWNLAFGRRDARRDDPCEAPPDLRDQLLALGAERAGRRSDLPGEGGFGPWKLGALPGPLVPELGAEPIGHHLQGCVAVPRLHRAKTTPALGKCAALAPFFECRFQLRVIAAATGPGTAREAG